MTFIDEAEAEFTSGDGGSGAVSFHREKHVPRGGPNGADGGRGGNIILVADRNRRTLYDFRLQSKYRAENGSHALGNKRGKNGASITIKVPIGTLVHDKVLGETLADLNYDGAKIELCKGGRGGKGNLHFTSSVRQAPNFAEKGEPGETIIAKLELKLLADIGLIGLPNAGKSTLLSQISRARPKIADYPFTTIVPNLGVVIVGDESFVVGDMPGLIEGASEGVGLGYQFLKHVERTRALVHVVDCFPIDESNPRKNFDIVEDELRAYSIELFERPRIIALNKIDIIDSDSLAKVRLEFANLEFPIFEISAATGKGTDTLCFAMLESIKAGEKSTVTILTPQPKASTAEDWEIVVDEGGFEITGKKVVRMVAMTDLNNRDSVRYLHRRLERMGVIDKLREMGAKEGETVHVGNAVFTFTDES